MSARPATPEWDNRGRFSLDERGEMVEDHRRSDRIVARPAPVKSGERR